MYLNVKPGCCEPAECCASSPAVLAGSAYVILLRISPFCSQLVSRGRFRGSVFLQKSRCLAVQIQPAAVGTDTFLTCTIAEHNSSERRLLSFI